MGLTILKYWGDGVVVLLFFSFCFYFLVFPFSRQHFSLTPILLGGVTKQWGIPLFGGVDSEAGRGGHFFSHSLQPHFAACEEPKLSL